MHHQLEKHSLPPARRHVSRRAIRYAVVGCLLLSVAAVAGCGGSGRPASAKATGKVAFQGQPLTMGEVHFVRPDTGDAGSAPLDPTGTFSLAAGIPPGTYRVFVLPPAASIHPSATEAAPAVVVPSAFPVPERYRNEVSSGLTAEVKAGSNTFDFQLQ